MSPRRNSILADTNAHPPSSSTIPSLFPSFFFFPVLLSLGKLARYPVSDLGQTSINASSLVQIQVPWLPIAVFSPGVRSRG